MRVVWKCCGIWRSGGGGPTPVTLTPAGAAGLTNASDALWPKARRLRCGLHKMQNLQQKVPPQAWPEFKALVIDRRAAPTVRAAEQRRQAIVSRSPRDLPEACRCLRDEAEASLKHLSVPQRPQPYVRPAHRAERAFAEERRRTKVLPPLGDEGSGVKLVFALLRRGSERWGKKGFSEFEQQQIRSLRRRLKLDEQEGTSSPPPTETQPRRSAASAA